MANEAYCPRSNRFWPPKIAKCSLNRKLITANLRPSSIPDLGAT